MGPDGFSVTSTIPVCSNQEFHNRAHRAPKCQNKNTVIFFLFFGICALLDILGLCLKRNNNNSDNNIYISVPKNNHEVFSLVHKGWVKNAKQQKKGKPI